ncbi:MAG: type II secretion system GspH family protein [Armatimonadetes bacterium]|nr:type II secretion system GspH family protein [Armatimonadota bacterium]
MRRGYTLLEVMMVVLMMGLLMSIIAPNLVKRRSDSRLTTVRANLETLQDAKVRWAVETNASPTAVPTSANLVPDYLREWPAGPIPGTYSAGAVNALPSFENITLDRWKDRSQRATILGQLPF